MILLTLPVHRNLTTYCHELFRFKKYIKFKFNEHMLRFNYSIINSSLVKYNVIENLLNAIERERESVKIAW